MGVSSLRRVATAAVVAAGFLAAGCDHHCGLGERDRVTVTSGQTGPAPGNGGAVHQDVQLKGATSDAEFSLANTNLATQGGGVDAFLVPTTCDKLFEGGYPGGTPMCQIYAGPAKPGGVSSRVKLAPGTYRVYLQGYSDVSSSMGFLVDVYIWDYSCGPLIQ